MLYCTILHYTRVTWLASTPTAPQRRSILKSMTVVSREPEARSRGAPEVGFQELKLMEMMSPACGAATGSKGTRPGRVSRRIAPLLCPQAATHGEIARAVSLSGEAYVYIYIYIYTSISISISISIAT